MSVICAVLHCSWLMSPAAQELHSRMEALSDSLKAETMLHPAYWAQHCQLCWLKALRFRLG